MLINDNQARKILIPLYNIAEKDANDIIANAASALAVRLEVAKREYKLSDLEIRIIRHAIQNAQASVSSPKHQRKTYKRRVSLG